MNRWLGRLGAAALLTAFVLGAVQIARLRFGRGGLYPPFSSLNAEPDGTRLLADSLQSLPNYRVTRNLRPLEALAATPPRLIVFAGLSPADWNAWNDEETAALDAAIRAGGRVVFAFDPKTLPVPGAPPDHAVAAQRTWGIEIRQHAGAAMDFLPDHPADWRDLPGDTHRPRVLVRAFGRGTLVICAGAAFLTNAALAEQRDTPLLAWLVGSTRQATFDESHLGVMESSGVVALARRYGMGGALLLVLAAVGLYAWNRMALLIPAPEEPRAATLRYAATAGLERLLRKSVPSGRLLQTCLEEWRASGGSTAVANPEGDPVQVYNALLSQNRRPPL